VCWIAPGTFTFHRNLTDDLWSAFDADRNSKPGPWEEVLVQCRTLADLIAEHGRAAFHQD
jgi:hypothetical protein